MFNRLLIASFVGASALLACSSESNHPGSAVASAGSSNHSTGGASGGSSTGGVANSAASGNAAIGGTGPILILDPDAGAADPDAGSECSHLNIGILGNPGARASSNFQQWLVASGTSAQRIHTTSNEALTSTTLQLFDVVVLDWLTRQYTADEAAIFANWVSAGGGVVSMSGYANTASDWNANSLLAPLQVAYGGSLLTNPVESFAVHPVTAGLTSVTFTGGYAVSDLGGSASTRTPIAFFSDSAKTTVGVAVQMGKGRAVVWGDEWIEFDSEWSTLPQIPQFWVQVFAWIAPVHKCELSPPK
ncbi:MAG TPA: hypothetical protein VHM25_21235 [Polyangiaceae bacterium]|nr:hypothetical protein [Polyangiaceae bacterium]